MNKTILAKGIDVSRWQGTIDWNKVKAAGIDFAMIRAGYCGYAGNITQDPQFAANMKGAVTAGIDVGVYLYSYAKTASAAKTAAAELLELIAPYQLTYPVAFDIEDEINVAMGKAENTAICKAFLSTIAGAGYCPILYTSKNFAESSLTMSELPYDLWVAHVDVAQTTYAGDYTMWQYSWTGSVAGISGDVDLNHGYKDYPAYIRELAFSCAALLMLFPRCEFDVCLPVLALVRYYKVVFDQCVHQGGHFFGSVGRVQGETHGRNNLWVSVIAAEVVNSYNEPVK